MTSERTRLIRDTYDRLAVEYGRYLADELAGKPLDRQLLDRFADEGQGSGPLCDLGCGPGHIARYLHDRGVDVRGIDLSPAMVEEARRLNPGITFQVGDMLVLDDVPAATFAGVVAFYAIVHLAADTLPTAFREIHRILKPGGRVLLAFHVGDDVLRPGELWGVPITLDWIFHQTEAVVRTLTSAGLTATEVIERDPYAGVEHASRRAYVFAIRAEVG
jgi:SAM-dependent methyltransferase